MHLLRHLRTMARSPRRAGARALGLGLGLLAPLGLSPSSSWALPPPAPPSPVPTAVPPKGATPRAVPGPRPPVPSTASAAPYQPVPCLALQMDPSQCSEKQVSDLLKPYNEQALSPAEETRGIQDQTACLEQYYQHTRCVHAACFLADGLNALARQQGTDNAQQMVDAARYYGTLCLSCTSKTGAHQYSYRTVEQFQPPVDRRSVRAQKLWGGLLLGLGGASLAAGLSMLPFNGRLSETPDCNSAGLPVPCVNQLDTPIAVTLGLGGAAAVTGAILLGLGCTACKNWPAPTAVVSSAPDGGNP